MVDEVGEQRREVLLHGAAAEAGPGRGERLAEHLPPGVGVAEVAGDEDELIRVREQVPLADVLAPSREVFDVVEVLQRVHGVYPAHQLHVARQRHRHFRLEHAQQQVLLIAGERAPQERYVRVVRQRHLVAEKALLADDRGERRQFRGIRRWRSLADARVPFDVVTFRRVLVAPDETRPGRRRLLLRLRQPHLVAQHSAVGRPTVLGVVVGHDHMAVPHPVDVGRRLEVDVRPHGQQRKPVVLVSIHGATQDHLVVEVATVGAALQEDAVGDGAVEEIDG